MTFAEIILFGQLLIRPTKICNGYLCCHLNEDLRMALNNFQELLRGTGRLAAALLPLLQGAFDTPTLRQVWPGKARSSNVGLLFFSSFDLPNTIQDFLPHIAFGLEGGECLSSQPLIHLFSILLCH